MNNLDTILISVLTPLITCLTGLLGWLLNRYKRNSNLKDIEKEKNKQLKKMLNYIMGMIDIVISDNFKIEPDIKKELKKISEKYHYLDKVKKDL